MRKSKCCDFGEYKCEKSVLVDGKKVGVDMCIMNIVQALNDNGIRTVASCCGHKKMNGVIALKDGRTIILISPGVPKSYLHNITFVVELSNDNNIPAFAYYISPTVKTGKAKIRLNFKALCDIAFQEKINFYELISKVTLHEILHALEDIFKKSFNEKEVEHIIGNY